MIRKLSLVLGVLLLAAACGDARASGPTTTTSIPIFIGQPPPPDVGRPGPDPGGAVLPGPAFVNDVDVTLLGKGRARFTVAGAVPTPCHQLILEVGSPGADKVIGLDAWSEIPADAVCIQVLQPFVATRDVSGLRAGAYSVHNGGREFMTFAVPDSLACDDDEQLDCDGQIDIPVDERFEGIFPVTDWEAYDRLAGQVDNGHQPWLLDAEETAAAYLRQVYGDAPAGLTFRSLGESFGEAGWPGGRVVLWQPATNGPWVVTALETALADVAIGDYRGDTIYVGVNLHAAGRLVVSAGVFASEWSAHSEHDVADGDYVETELLVGRDGSGPERLLIEVRLTSPEGTESFGYFSVYRTNIVYND